MKRALFNCQKYNVEHITSIKQVQDFASYLILSLKVNANPDTNFSDYIEYKTSKPTFNQNEIKRGNQLMDECFEVCKMNSVNIYDIFFKILYKSDDE